MLARALAFRSALVVRSASAKGPLTPPIPLNDTPKALPDLASVKITKDYLRHLESIVYGEPVDGKSHYSEAEKKEAYNQLVIGTKIYNLRATERHKETHARYSAEITGHRRRNNIALYGVTFAAIMVCIQY